MSRAGTPQRVVEDLVSAGLVDRTRASDAQTVVSRSLAVVPPGRTREIRGLFVEIGAYVGGALVVAAVGLFLAQEWNDIDEAGRALTLAGIAVLLGLAGLVLAMLGGGYAAARGGRDEVRRRLVATLLTAACLVAAFALDIEVALLLDSNFDWSAFSGGVAMLVLGTASYAFMPSALGVVAMAGAAVQSVLTGWSAADPMQSGLWSGLILLGLAAVWLIVTETGWFRELMVARVLGVAGAVFGAQVTLIDGTRANLSYALTALVAVAAFAMYVRTAAWPYLAGGVAATTLVVTEAVVDWTEGALGPAGGVLVAGLTLLAASVAGFRVRRRPVTDAER